MTTRDEAHAMARIAFEEAASGLVGESVVDVRYSDIYNYRPEPDQWDYGDWHHAVMGAELVLGSGPASIIWTDTFHPYGVEVFREPLSNHLVEGPDGPRIWAVGAHPAWQQRIGLPISGAAFLWDRIEVGAGYLSDGRRVSEPASYTVPTGLRLDFAAAEPVWFVAAMPDPSDPSNSQRAFVNGDEIMVVFTAEQLSRLGLSDS